MNSKRVIDLANYNVSREDTKVSKLGEIQKIFIDLFFQMPNLTDSQIEIFESHLYSNPEMFPKNIDYSNIRDIASYFNAKKQDYIQSQTFNLNGGKTM